MILGYDWPRLHAALNDFPAAVLLVSVLFDLLGAATKRDSLKAAGFWTLIAGVIGTGLAVIAGNMAADRVQHDEQAHGIMATHQTLAYIVLALFAALAIWRLVRRGMLTPREQPVYLTAGVIGVVLLIVTARLGGELMFDHALGIPTAQLQVIQAKRAADHHEHGEEDEAHQPSGMAMPADSAGAAHDSAARRTPAAADSAKR